MRAFELTLKEKHPLQKWKLARKVSSGDLPPTKPLTDWLLVPYDFSALARALWGDEEYERMCAENAKVQAADALAEEQSVAVLELRVSTRDDDRGALSTKVYIYPDADMPPSGTLSYLKWLQRRVAMAVAHLASQPNFDPTLDEILSMGPPE